MSQLPSDQYGVEENDDIMQVPVETQESQDRPGTSEKMAQLERELTTLKQTTAQPNQLMQHIMANPAVAEVLRLQQSGEKFVIQKGDGAPATPEPTFELPTDGTPVDPKKLLEYMEAKTQRMIEGVVSRTVGGLNQKLEQVTNVLGQQQMTQAQQQIETTAKKYKDFWQYAPEMKSLSQANPTLSAEELYLVTKTRAGQPVSRDHSTDSERPTADTGSATQTRRRQPPQAGQRGMDAAFEAAWARCQGRR